MDNFDSIKKEFERSKSQAEIASASVYQIPDFPICIFPKKLQEFILEINQKQYSPQEYTSAGILSAVAVALGSKIQVDNGGYKSRPILWTAIVGDSGTGKHQH